MSQRISVAGSRPSSRRVLATLFCLGVAATTPTLAIAQTPDTDEALLQLSAAIFQAQIVDRDASLLERHASDGFRVLAPGGLFENKEQAMAGVSSWDAVGIEISGTEVVRHGPVAIVMGRLDVDGEMQPVGRFGPLKFMSTFLREDGEWRLLSRSLTPCLPMLIQMGRC